MRRRDYVTCVAGDDDPPGIPSGILKPYASLVVLICARDIDPADAFDQLTKRLRAIRRISGSRMTTDIAADGLQGTSVTTALLESSFDQYDIVVHRTESRPGWLTEPAFIDVRHELTVTFC